MKIFWSEADRIATSGITDNICDLTKLPKAIFRNFAGISMLISVRHPEL